MGTWQVSGSNVQKIANDALLKGRLVNMNKPWFFVRLSLVSLMGCFSVACTQTGKQEAIQPIPAVEGPQEPEAVKDPRGPITTETAPNATPLARPTENGEKLFPITVTPKVDYQTLIGRNFDGVEEVLGRADVIIDVPPGREWQYRDGPCVLVVRFFPDLKTLGYRVLSIAFEGREGASDKAKAASGVNAVGKPTGASQNGGVSVSEQQCRARLASRFKPER